MSCVNHSFCTLRLQDWSSRRNTTGRIQTLHCLGLTPKNKWKVRQYFINLLNTGFAFAFNNTNNSSSNNKWSRNFEERSHLRLVTPRGSEWIRPTSTFMSMVPWANLSQPSERHLNRFSRTWPTDRHTDRRPRYSVCTNRPHLMQCVRCGLIIIIIKIVQ